MLPMMACLIGKKRREKQENLKCSRGDGFGPTRNSIFVGLGHASSGLTRAAPLPHTIQGEDYHGDNEEKSDMYYCTL